LKTAIVLGRGLLEDDSFLIDSMNSIDADPVITSKLEIGGQTLRRIMQHSSLEGYLDLEPKNAFESVLATHIVCATNTSHECFNQAERHFEDADAHGVYLGLALRLAEKVKPLTELFEGYRARCRKLVEDAPSPELSPAATNVRPFRRSKAQRLKAKLNNGSPA
jgi:hypothetical protein